MPFLNELVQVIHGGGGLPGHLDGKQYPALTYGRGQWLTKTSILCQLRENIAAPGAPACLAIYTPSSGSMIPLNLTGDPNKFWQAGDFAANGGNFIAWLAGVGVYGTLSAPDYDLSAAGVVIPFSVGPDGAKVFVPNRQNGVGLVLVNPDGSLVDIPGINPQDVQVLGANKVRWKGGAHGLDPAKPALANAAGLQTVFVDGVEWLVYWSEGLGLIAQINGATDGWVIDRRPNEFHYHAVAANGKLWLAWSTTDGEGPDDVVVCSVATAGVSYGSVAPYRLAANWAPATPTWEQFVVAPPVVITPNVSALPRKIWVAPYYSHSVRYGDTPIADHVGNAITVVAGTADNPTVALKAELDRIRPLGLPMIVQGGVAIEAVNLNQVIAWLVSGTDMNNLGQNVYAALGMPEKPVIAYLDNRNWPTAKPAWMSGRVWPAVQAYRGPGEDMGVFAASMNSVMANVSGYGQPIVLTPRFDDFNGSGSVNQTLEAMPLYDQWLRKFFVVGLMPFADRRGNGIAKVPAFRAWAKAFLAANPARPNRFDYWVPSGGVATALRNKLMQTTETIVLMPEEKTYILGLLPK